MLNLAPIDQRDDLATKGYVDDAVGAVKAPYGFEVSATLSTAGWYRVCKTANQSGSILKFYANTVNVAETHEVDLMVSGAATKFANEISVCTHVYIDKIRCTYSGSDLFIDVHYNTASENVVKVGVAAYGKASDNNVTTPSNLVGVNDAPSGETVAATYEFAASTNNGFLVIDSATPGETTLAAGAGTTKSIALSRPGYEPLGVIGFYGVGNTGIAIGDCRVYNDYLYVYAINTGSASRTFTIYCYILWRRT